MTVASDKNTAEFANSIGIELNRFNELCKLVAVVLDHNIDASWSAVMRQCMVFGQNALEVLFIGMILGREMQAGLCSDICQGDCENKPQSPIAVLVLHKEPNHKP